MSYARFRRDPHYLLQAHAARAAVFLAAIGFVLLVDAPSRLWLQWPWLLCSLLLAIPALPINLLAACGCVAAWTAAGLGPLSGTDIIWIGGGMVVGLYSATLMHICAHGKPQGRLWRSALGELCAMQQLTGFQDWTVIHMIHHSNSDHPQNDPHYASQTNFIAYAAAMKFKIARFLERYYLELWQSRSDARRLWNATAFFIIFGHFAACVLWLVLLGPKLFVLCFVSGLLTNSYFYCHFNYFTHRPNETGAIQILNLGAGLYRVLNWMLLGIFYHKDHHENPMRVNPMQSQ